MIETTSEWAKWKVITPLLVGGILVLASGCERIRPTEVAPVPDALKAAAAMPLRAAVKGSKYPRPQEDAFVQLANEVPGSAGFS